MRIRIGIDLDGTLIDSKYRHYMLLVDLIKHFDQSSLGKLSYDEFIAYKENGYSTLAFLERIQIENCKSISDEWIERIEYENYLEHDKLFPETVTFLGAMCKKSQLYLVTARNDEKNALKQIRKLGIVDYFEKLVIVKPGETAALAKARETGELNLRMAIGDSEIDSEWAALLGVAFFALNRGFRNKQWWESKGIRSYDNLVAVQKEIEQYLEDE